MEWLACDVCSNSIILVAFLKTQNASNLISTNHKIITITEETNNICKIFINYTNIYWTFTRKHYSSARNTVMRRTKFPHIWRKPIWLELKRWNTRELGRSPVSHKVVQLLLFPSVREATRAVFSSLFGIRIIPATFQSNAWTQPRPLCVWV